MILVYIDITQLDRGRANTGIQRVVKEFIQRAVENTHHEINYKIISFNVELDTFELLSNHEIIEFVLDVSHYKFTKKKKINFETIKIEKNTIFFDMDSSWNSPKKRNHLYPKLKKKGFLIFNFIYDLVPIVLPKYAHIETVKNFKSFIASVYNFSDMVFFDSLSAENDFLKTQKDLKFSRDIPTRIFSLGADFLKTSTIVGDDFKTLMKSKYILFVGTIEPRKSQDQMLLAFDVLSKKHPDLNLILIGRQGWNVEYFIKKLIEHPLLNKKIFWLNNIDDTALSHFYKNAFIVTYLSKYEGYGLPIAESLLLSNVTITSKNSSMYEVGRDFPDYIEYDSQNELVDIISLYVENTSLYQAKKDYIKKFYKTVSWDCFYQSIRNVLKNFEYSLEFRCNHSNTLQFVFISIDFNNLQGTINAIDKYINFVKEYIIITSPELVNKFKKINSIYKLKIIDENSLLKEHQVNFSKRDHQNKNWLLRTSLLNLENLDEEFVMLDDDNRPLKELTIDYFINSEGQYNCYYFYNLLDWNLDNTDYDRGQKNTKNILSDKNYELLSYSSHAPQIINKTLFKKVIKEFYDIGLTLSIDEWSIYFNYSVSLYPYAFNKKIYQTLNWPDNPFYWELKYTPEEISFENYYKEVYESGFFTKNMTLEDKKKIKNKQIKPFELSRSYFIENKKVLSVNNMVHGICIFKDDKNNIELYLSNIPYTLLLSKNSDIRLKVNYKLLNPELKTLDIEVILRLNGNVRLSKKIKELKPILYQESIIDMPINSSRLKESSYDLTLDAKINGNMVYAEKSPYLIKLFVNENNILTG